MLRILLVLFAFLGAIPASAAVEMAFYSHDMTMRGEKIVEFPHAFVTVKGTPDAGGPAIDSNYGFTASKISPAILVGPVKGAMVKAGRTYVGKSRRHFAIRLADARFAAVRSAYKKWSAVRGLSYDLDTRNCVHFIAELARSAGLAVPSDPSLVKKPREFLDALAARNPARAAGLTPGSRSFPAVRETTSRHRRSPVLILSPSKTSLRSQCNCSVDQAFDCGYCIQKKNAPHILDRAHFNKQFPKYLVSKATRHHKHPIKIDLNF